MNAPDVEPEPWEVLRHFLLGGVATALLAGVAAGVLMLLPDEVPPPLQGPSTHAAPEAEPPAADEVPDFDPCPGPWTACPDRDGEGEVWAQ